MKKALLIGINYVGHTQGVLSGCINDARNLSELLKTQYGYEESEITMITDETATKPTKQNILKAIHDLVVASKTENLDEIWISYSGHGSHSRDFNSDEADGQDESLVPINYQTHGVIKDDVLHHMFSMVNEKTKVVALIDACHSGSVLDLKYRYTSGLKEVVENKRDYVRSNVVMISGSKDDQTSADFYDRKKMEGAGAMTVSFLTVMADCDYDITCYKLLKKMREHLKTKGFTQIPQLTCTRKLSNTSVFSLNNSESVQYLTVEKK
jgi:hypothetical protein